MRTSPAMPLAPDLPKPQPVQYLRNHPPGKAARRAPPQHAPAPRLLQYAEHVDAPFACLAPGTRVVEGPVGGGLASLRKGGEARAQRGRGVCVRGCLAAERTARGRAREAGGCSVPQCT